MAKASKLDMAKRENEILDLISKGKRRIEIGKMMCEKWNCSQQAIERQYDKIMEKMVEQTETEREHKRAEILMRMDEICRQAQKDGSFKMALDGLEKQARLYGLYEKHTEKKEEKPPEITFGRRLKAVPEGD